MLSKLLKHNILIPLGIVLIVVLIAQTNSFQSLNNNIYDLFLYLNRSNEYQNNIILVEIDRKSIKSINKWPWERKIHGKLLDILHQEGAKAIGIYLQFTTASNKEDDELFISALKKVPTVLIDSDFSYEGVKNKSFSSLIKKHSLQGHNIIPKDKDTIIRNQFLWMNHKPSFALATLNLYDKDKYGYQFDKETVLFKNKRLKAPNGTALLPINFHKKSNKIQTISYIDVLDNKYPENYFKNKIVIVGFVVEGLHDAFITPFSKHQPIGMPGTSSQPMIQAQIIDSLINNNFIYKIPNEIIYLLLSGLIILSFFLLKFQGLIRLTIIYLVAIPVSILILSFLLFKYSLVWLTPFEFILASIVLFIASSVNLVLNTSNFIDQLLGDLNIKEDPSSSNAPLARIDEKYSNLAKAINIIQNDKSILDLVLNSIHNDIMLFNDKGYVVYSNNDKYNQENFNIESISNAINIVKIKETIEKENSCKLNLFIKDNNYEYFTCMAKDNLYLGVLNDITDMVKMNEMKSNILRMLSHELKAPLASIMLCADSVKITDNKPSIDNHIDQILNQTEYVENLILNFLSLNKLEVTDFELNQTTIIIEDFITQLINELNVIAESKNICINYKNNCENNEIQGDKQYLKIAIKNLIDNAIKYSPENTTITIITKDTNTNTTLSIIDQGYGIAEEHVPKLFNKFYRIKDTNKELTKGTGLGLSFVKRITELHKGTIAIKSELNKGSEFIITLPKNKASN